MTLAAPNATAGFDAPPGQAAVPAMRSTREELAAGWSALLAAVIGVFAAVQIIFFYANGVLIPLLAKEFGWSRTELSIPATIMALVGAVGAPLCGLIVDRLGARAVAVPSMLASALAYWLLGHMTTDLMSFLVLSSVLACVGIGSSVVAFVSVVGKTFRRARGLAIGITMAATGLSGAVIPSLVTHQVQSGGWRQGYTLMAWLMLGAALLVYLFLRLGKAGGPEASTPTPAAGKAGGWGMTLAEARRTSVFWRLAISLFLLTTGLTGLLVHFIPTLMASGVSATSAAAAAGLMGVAVIAGRLTAGFVLDRIFAPYVACTAAVIAALGCALLAFDAAAFGFAGAAMIGLAMGAEVDVAGYIVGRYFGTRHYASIYGWQHGIFTAGGILSPLAIGMLYDVTGGYRTGLTITPLLLLVMVPLLAGLGRYPDEHGE